MQKNNLKLSFSLLVFLQISSLNASDFASLLFHGNCTTCHIETEAISAPSVIEFKNSYLRAFPLRKDFVTYMSQWVKHPTEDTSIMLDAVNKYKLMPELAFEKSALEDIAGYIYDTDFTKKHKGHKNNF